MKKLKLQQRKARPEWRIERRSFFSGYGNNTVDGGKSNDKLYGEEGDDSLNGWTGNDLINGRDGTDTANHDNEDSLVTSIEILI